MDEATERRKAENEAIFRRANEQICDARVELVDTEARTPFLCECSDPHCREIVLLELSAYELARAEPTRFVISASHATGDADVVQAGDGYTIIAKHGIAAKVASATDPRAA